jgi:peroxiredoxin
MYTSNLLGPGDPFPALSLAVAGGDRLDLPAAVAGHYAVVLVYRGSWCPYCNAQLRAFARARDQLDELGIRVVAMSVDDDATTRALVDKQRITFPVGHSVDATAIHDALGAFVHTEPEYLESTGFVLDPAGRVLVSVYSSNAIGRLVPEDVVGLVRYVREQPAAAA